MTTKNDYGACGRQMVVAWRPLPVPAQISTPRLGCNARQAFLSLVALSGQQEEDRCCPAQNGDPRPPLPSRRQQARLILTQPFLQYPVCHGVTLAVTNAALATGWTVGSIRKDHALLAAARGVLNFLRVKETGVSIIVSAIRAYHGTGAAMSYQRVRNAITAARTDG